MNEEWEEDEYLEEAEHPEEQFLRSRRVRARREGQNNWYLLTGLVIGLGLGLLVAWVISPVKFTDTAPVSLSPKYKDTYRQVIALAYNANRNLARARERVNLIDAGNSLQQLAAQAQHMLAENQPAQEARALAVLAADLSRPDLSGTPTGEVVAGSETNGTPGGNVPGAGAAGPQGTQEIPAAVQTATLPLPTRTPTATLTPMPTFTPRPTATPLRVLDAPFALKTRRDICDGSVTAGLLQLMVSDAEGRPLPGVRISVTWQNGEDTFYTGLTPQISPGYADYQMAQGSEYSIRVGEVSEILNNVRAAENCALRLEYTQQKGN